MHPYKKLVPSVERHETASSGPSMSFRSSYRGNISLVLQANAVYRVTGSHTAINLNKFYGRLIACCANYKNTPQRQRGLSIRATSHRWHADPDDSVMTDLPTLHPHPHRWPVPTRVLLLVISTLDRTMAAAAQGQVSIKLSVVCQRQPPTPQSTALVIWAVRTDSSYFYAWTSAALAPRRMAVEVGRKRLDGPRASPIGYTGMFRRVRRP